MASNLLGVILFVKSTVMTSALETAKREEILVAQVFDDTLGGVLSGRCSQNDCCCCCCWFWRPFIEVTGMVGLHQRLYYKADFELEGKLFLNSDPHFRGGQ